MRPAALACALAAALLAPAAAGAVEGAEGAAPAVGVAPFERVAPEGRAVPDVAERLAARLGTSGLPRVVGPASLGAEASAEPAPEAAQGWAAEGGVDALVVGRTTRIGDALSVDARLLSGTSGEALGTPLLEEVSGPDDLGRAVDALAEKLVARLESAKGSLPPVAARRESGAQSGEAAPEASAEQGRAEASATTEEALGSAFSGDQPISIQSEELEAFQGSGERRFVFTGDVRAEQGELTLRSDRLEAFYPGGGGSRPERLVARGNVEMEEGGRRALCDRAVFHREDKRVVCSGNARLDQGCDRVRGEEIVFHLDTEVMQVQGAADVRIHPEESECDPDGASPP